MLRTTATALLILFVCLPASGQSNQPALKIGAENEIRAHRTDTPPKIDGILDDAIWAQITPTGDFVQLTPNEGAPPAQRSEFRIAYDDNYLYFAFQFFDTEPDKIRARNLERGGPNGNDDMVWLMLDTYDDNRNAYVFETNVLGTQDDALVTDESFTHSAWQWDGIFRSQGRIDDEGWSLEYAIPFRTIRFSKDEEPRMGIAVMRFLNRTFERSMWPFIPRRYSAGIFQVSQYASLTGLSDIHRGRNIEIKPFVITGAQEIRVDPTTTTTDFTRDAGIDIKYGITSNLTLDVTVNTDFAQVESDVVQLDLTRFNLFFPEKREFFLERSGLFEFGDSRTTETFFSRRIGIENDILAGARLTGQVGKVSVGLLNIQTRKNSDLDLPAANNSVARIRADVLPRTTVGAIVTNLEQGNGYNRSFGADVSRRFWGNSEVSGWLTGVTDDNPLQSDIAGSVDLSLRTADYRFFAGYQNVGKHFAPALGFVRRTDMKRYRSTASYNPQFGLSGPIRSVSVFASGSLTNGQDNSKQSSDIYVSSGLRFRSNDGFSIDFERGFERLENSFVVDEAEILPGDYISNDFSISAQTNGSRPLSASGGIALADFFGGDRTIYSAGIGVRTGKYLNFNANLDHNSFDLPVENGNFDATTFTLSINAAQSRKLFAKALVQYDNFSRDLQANIRIDWIHSPGADLFLVFNTNYNFTGEEDQFDFRSASLNNQVGVAKLTYVIQL
ncbi:MAG: carbohydrate binding family 9 domain-containing protein [Rhodothermales bacterium]|nr:carbohydrate binding family 9 domain-containing protein [Rhodothermales bacterium]